MINEKNDVHHTNGFQCTTSFSTLVSRCSEHASTLRRSAPEVQQLLPQVPGYPYFIHRIVKKMQTWKSMCFGNNWSRCLQARFPNEHAISLLKLDALILFAVRSRYPPI